MTKTESGNTTNPENRRRILILRRVTVREGTFAVVIRQMVEVGMKWIAMEISKLFVKLKSICDRQALVVETLFFSFIG